ncbi:F0F1-type ATP synthase assembly protein I [Arcanobacterium hippocoleae]|uniref:F0F1-type ATP synthase assembly protein I n=1 Tax=Arcanobacterium hippocoleae TaxID=149017 RepID=A0ABU1T3G8_9ACTO|nr:hypothetical protein [Arcanobacterium hippocoleae]MDR6939853.1 F0F1-type ATP synthase assembly protein I [Arcanobacterium hippocoleae]
MTPKNLFQQPDEWPITTAKVWIFRANIWLAIAGMCFALLLGLGAAFFWPAVLVLNLLVIGLLILGWASLIGLPSQKTSQLGMILIALLGVLAAIFRDIHWIALIAGIGILLAFVQEMFRKQSALRRLEQISGSYLGMILILSATFWTQTVTSEFGKQVVLVFSAVIGVVSLISLFTTRSVFVVSLINALTFGIGIAYLLDVYLSVGAIAGVVVAVAYRLSFEAFNSVYRTPAALPVLAYIALPTAAIGFIAQATVMILG